MVQLTKKSLAVSYEVVGWVCKVMLTWIVGELVR